MTRKAMITSLLIVAAAMAAILTVVVAKTQTSSAFPMNDKQRSAREKFFGTAEKLGPIPKGQEMRPRW